MPFVSLLAFGLIATMPIDIAVVLLAASRGDIFWPTVFCLFVGSLSALLMAAAFLDFDASPTMWITITCLGVMALVSLPPALRSVA